MKMYNTMEDNYSDIITPDDWVPTDSLIKVVGVGGGGCNAVTYMYEQKIEGCTFIVSCQQQRPRKDPARGWQRGRHQPYQGKECRHRSGRPDRKDDFHS